MWRVGSIVYRRGAKSVISVLFDKVAASVGQMRNAAFVILLIIKGLILCQRGIGPHQNLVDPFAIQILPPHVAIYAVLKNRPFTVVNVVLDNSIHDAFHAAPERI